MSEPSTTAFRTNPEHVAGFYADVPAPEPAPAQPVPAEVPAGFWPRLGAYAIDWMIIAGNWVVVAVIATAGLSQTVTEIAFFVVAFFYWPILWAFNHGATWGMQAASQRVVRHADHAPVGPVRALAREASRAVLALLLFPVLISALMIALRKDKRALHDLMAGTTVIRVNSDAL